LADVSDDTGVFDFTVDVCARATAPGTTCHWEPYEGETSAPVVAFGRYNRVGAAVNALDVVLDDTVPLSAPAVSPLQVSAAIRTALAAAAIGQP
jgi:hypothetical protein